MSMLPRSPQRPSRYGLRLVLALAPVCCLLTAGPVLAQQTSPPAPSPQVPKTSATNAPYTIQIAYKAGDVDRYHLTGKTVINNPQTGGKDFIIGMDLGYKDTTKSVDTDGSAVLVETFDSGSMTYPQQTVDLMTYISAAKVTRTQNKVAKVLDTKSEGFTGPLKDGNVGNMQVLSQVIMGLYPSKPVKSGDTWKIEYTFTNAAASDVKISGTSTLVGTETIDGVKTLKIKSEANGTAPAKTPVKIHIESTGNVDAQTGKLVRLSTSPNTDMGAQGKVRMDLTLTRSTLKAADNPPMHKP